MYNQKTYIMAYIEKNEKEKITLLILVRVLARKFVETKIPFKELEEWGKEGLNEAKRRYEPSCGFKFVPYAAWFIKQNIKNAEFLYSKKAV